MERASWRVLRRARRVDARDCEARSGLRVSGHVQRSEVVSIGDRYLLALAYNHEGEWGLFDAPEPWGPWTEVPGVESWGIAGTHGYRMPAKWIGEDGPRNDDGVLGREAERRVLHADDAAGAPLKQGLRRAVYAAVLVWINAYICRDWLYHPTAPMGSL